MGVCVYVTGSTLKSLKLNGLGKVLDCPKFERLKNGNCIDRVDVTTSLTASSASPSLSLFSSPSWSPLLSSLSLQPCVQAVVLVVVVVVVDVVKIQFKLLINDLFSRWVPVKLNHCNANFISARQMNQESLKVHQIRRIWGDDAISILANKVFSPVGVTSSYFLPHRGCCQKLSSVDQNVASTTVGGSS